jgi:hypothetical protein
VEPPGKLTEIAQLVSAIGGFAWPATAIFVLVLARERLLELLNSLIERVKSSTDLKIGFVELKGILIDSHGDVIKGHVDGFEVIAASAEDLQLRSSLYSETRGIMLVHTVRPVFPARYVNGSEVFDLSIYLHPHYDMGKLNDVKSVSYFLGDKFGKTQYGSKWKVSSANQQFALSVQAFGTFLCVAEIEFHDGIKAVTNRYIDSEMLRAYSSSFRGKSNSDVKNFSDS